MENLIKNEGLNVPDNVKTMVLQWLDRYGEAEIVPGTIIKCREEFMA